ncbi:uncharacterized protein FisN_2Hh575 [Fistulifera solaris]|uniref:Uncharacterized protein n=1 Tax=Fistulifera solaris TaxID=1519565 RepID=A0A1Z5JGC8_FISSO|nr:uncharacterized protein FisN_2Hh575 [Fistulifera solaris]|eukprot:GAX13065.1 uncharacterized protein FisN_2Hh575 [Fistulifera solaris]
MSLFTPVTGIVGGTLIGASAGTLLVLNGDIMGISGILSNSLLHPVKTLRDSKHHWRWVWIASFSLTVNMYVYFINPQMALRDDRSLASDVPIPSWPAHILGGLLVGIGTRIGNGCTSGHGICGISRFSLRSLVATCTFTGTAIFTQFVISPLRNWSAWTRFLRTSGTPYWHPWASALFTSAVCMVALVRPIPVPETVEDKKEQIVAQNKGLGAALSGMMFALGLSISGMTKTSKVHDFLCLSGFSNNTYDPTLMTVMGSGILASLLSYQMLSDYTVTKRFLIDSPISLPRGSSFSVPTNRAIDKKLLLGAVIFGTGWGLTGICPGPGLYAAAAGVVSALAAWMPSFLLGSHLGINFADYLSKKKIL